MTFDDPGNPEVNRLSTHADTCWQTQRFHMTPVTLNVNFDPSDIGDDSFNLLIIITFSCNVHKTTF